MESALSLECSRIPQTSLKLEGLLDYAISTGGA